MSEENLEFIGPIHCRSCNKCSEVKPLTEFHKQANGKWGRRSFCIPCHNAANLRWLHSGTPKANSNLIAHKLWSPEKRAKIIKRNVAWCKKSKTKDPIHWAWLKARNRCSHNGREFSIKESEIESDMICPVFGIRMEVNTGKPKANSPSLDRVDNNLGYVSGNVKVISHRANAIKSDASIEELEAILVYMKANLPDQSQQAA